jgi:hypothetical protein
VTFGPKEGVVTVRYGGDGNLKGLEGYWQSELVSPCLAAALDAAGSHLRRLAFLDARGRAQITYSVEWWPQPILPSPDEPSALEERVRARAEDAGLELRTLDVLPFTSAAVRVVLRLREDQLFDETAHRWQSTLFPADDASHPFFLIVDAPDGTPVYYGSGIETVGGGGTYASRPGGDTGEVVPLAGEPIPASLSGPTKLRVVVTTGLDQEEHRFELACQPEPTGVPDAASVCERILRERWALFVPGSEGVCSVPAGSHAVVIIGTVGGKPVDIGYDACYGATVERWEALLGMPSGHDS